MTSRPAALSVAVASGRVTSGNPETRYGAARGGRRALRATIATVALLGVVLAACSPSQSVSQPANVGAAAPKAGASIGIQVGQQAPSFTVTTLDGQALTSADLLAQEKPYILYFFASW